MNKPVKLDVANLGPNPQDKIITNLKPQIIYIPLEDKSGLTYNHLVKEGDYVYKGDIIATSKDNFPIHASVSGYVVRGEVKTIATGQKVKCLVIENDFKEKYRTTTGSKRNLSNYRKEEFLELLKTSGIVGLSGSAFPTYQKYQTKNPKLLIVNAVECEPYLTCDKALIYHQVEYLLEGIDAILDIMQIPRAIIAISENDFISAEELNKYIGTYPNITVMSVPSKYPCGWERELVKLVVNQTYHQTPSELGIITNNISTIYAIYEMLKYHRPLTERIVSLIGDNFTKPINIKVKIGTNMGEILPKIKEYHPKEDTIIIAGGPMMGTNIPTTDLIVTKDLNGLIITSNYHEKPMTPCIKCGKCSEVCPVSLIPNEVINSINNPSMLKKLKPNRCIECGLCSYICPAKIKIRDFVIKAKKEVKND